MIIRLACPILILSVWLSGCTRETQAPPDPAAATEPATAVANCSIFPPLDKDWEVVNVGSSLPAGEYLDQPQDGDRISATCEGHGAWTRYFIHFDKGGQKRFEDLSAIALRYVPRTGLLESQGVEMFLAGERHAEYMREVARSSYGFLLGSGMVRKGDGNETAVTVFAVPYTVKTDEMVESKLALILVNLGELKLASDRDSQEDATPEDEPQLLQGGVIHGRQ